MGISAGRFGVWGAAAPACADLGPCEEKYQGYTDCRGRRCYQYDYRAYDGTLFSCVRHTLNECVDARDKWLKERGVEA